MPENVSTFREFTNLLDSIVQNAIFDSDRWGSYTSAQLQQLYFSGNEISIHAVHSTKPRIDQRLLATLTERVRSVLHDYIIPGEDSIVNKLASAGGGVTEFSISDFVRLLLRAAALLGPIRAVQILFEWAENSPIHYWQHILLTGISVDQQLELTPSVHISALPSSSADIPHHIPSVVRFANYSDIVYAGLSKLSVEHKVTFLSKLPLKDDSTMKRLKQEHASIGLDDFAIEGFCQALALTCNHYISFVAAWKECGDWEVFRGGVSGGMTSRDGRPDHSRMIMSQNQFIDALKLFALLQSKGTTIKRLRIVISRWMQSKRDDAALTDKLIDLRIALEALYLQGMNDELGFRLATLGAWHLGVDFNERREYQKILREAYKLGSNAVHASEVKPSEKNRKLLTDAQDLCRKGILKRLDETEEPNWNEMILGKESGAAP